MKQKIENLLHLAIKNLQEKGQLPAIPAFIKIELSKNQKHGDFSSNVAFILSKIAQKKPLEIANQIVNAIPKSPLIEKIEIAGLGFINFFLTNAALTEITKTILEQKDDFGRCKIGREKKVLIEFVSSDPTGPLHVGHGRHAAFGDVIGNLLDAVGFKISREYYVNDAGRQMNVLAISVWCRYLELCDIQFPLPANVYQGKNISDIAQAIFAQHERHFCLNTAELRSLLPIDAAPLSDQEIYMDQLIERAKKLLGPKYQIVLDLALAHILADIREDLAEFGVNFDRWFSEKDFIASNIVSNVISTLKATGHVYERNDMIWFRSTDFGDEKDRVLVRTNGEPTYFANDVAYHLNKFERGFDIAIDIFGTDHHGYIPRMKATVQASGINPERLQPLLLQFVHLNRSGQSITMSTRTGNFVTLRELRNEVGNDAARLFYVMRKGEQPMDFDLNLAKSQSFENPVYYLQYAYARICSVFKQLQQRNMTFNETNGIANLSVLTEKEERALLNTLANYPDIIINAAIQYEPHVLANYLRELATDFHSYYNAHQFLVARDEVRDARLALLAATKQTLKNGLTLLGISTPENM